MDSDPKSGDENVMERLIVQWSRERPDLDVRSMGVVGRLIRLGRRMEEQAVIALREFDLEYSEFDVLATLRRSGAPFELTPTELRRSVLLSSGAMTACLKRLGRKGLIDRRHDLADRRSTAARLSPAGLRLIDVAFPARIASADRGVSLLTLQERRTLAKLLRKLESQ